MEIRPYKYTVVSEFLDLERLVPEHNPGSIDGKYAIHTDDNFLKPDLRPFPGQDGHKRALEALINRNGGPERCRLVYITRHAESDHNVKADVLGKAESAAAADHFEADRDPSLSAKGVEQAMRLGNQMLDSEAAAFGLPRIVHCSPLWRCVQTAAYSGGNYHFSLDIKLNDDWREWKGPGQLHVSDARSTKTVLSRRIDTLEGQLGGAEVTPLFPDRFTEKDEAFFEPETFVNVDIRLERALDELFQGDSLCRHIVTHGRTLHSLMRVLGFKRYSTGRKEYRVWDFENAGTIVTLLKREPRVDPMQQLEYDRALQQEEMRYINSIYQEGINDGFLRIQERARQDPEIRNIWMEKLNALREEMRVNNAVGWRYELLAKALQGIFQHGDFQVRTDDSLNGF
jgi:broad specificity phosphatase PhoE